MTGPVERDAALTVADHARDAADCRALLEVLGLLPESQATPDRTVAQATPDRTVIDGDVRHGHGRERMYTADGCRCDACRAKHAEAKRKTRIRAKADPSRADRAGHGKANTYKNHGCRCEACREAYRQWMANYNAGRRKAA